MTASAPRSRYIDSSGNEITRATYESLLAQNILEHPEFWKDVFDKFNKKINEVIKHNKDNSMMYIFKNIAYSLRYTFPEIKNVDTLFKELEEQKAVKNIYPNRFHFNFYKFFAEKIFNDCWILPNSPLLINNQNAITYGNIISGATILKNNLWRPQELFTDHGRGRYQIEDQRLSDLLTTTPGLTSEAAAHPKLRNKFKDNPSLPAKKQYVRMESSPTVQAMEKHEIPFSAGPSGTVGFLITSFYLLLGTELTQEDYKKFFMAITAHLVYEGHHTFAEIGMVINAVKGFLPSIAFPVDPALKNKEYYDQYLTEAYRTSEAYHQFYTQYHPNQYTAMTWQVLRDAVFEYEKHRLDKDYFQKNLVEFNKKNNDKSGELEPQELEQLKLLLQKAYKDKSLASNSAGLVQKLIKKLEDSGIPVVNIPKIVIKKPKEKKTIKRKITAEQKKLHSPVSLDDKKNIPAQPIVEKKKSSWFFSFGKKDKDNTQDNTTAKQKKSRSFFSFGKKEKKDVVKIELKKVTQQPSTKKHKVKKQLSVSAQQRNKKLREFIAEKRKNKKALTVYDIQDSDKTEITVVFHDEKTKIHESDQTEDIKFPRFHEDNSSSGQDAKDNPPSTEQEQKRKEPKGRVSGR